MVEKYIIFFFFLFFPIFAFSQIMDSTDCSWGKAINSENVTVFIKGKKNKDKIKWKFFYKEFELQTSDPSFKIEKFQMTWPIKRKGVLVNRIVLGNVIKTDILDNGQYSLKSIEPGSYITFDTIIIKKDGVCFKARPFIVYTILK